MTDETPKPESDIYNIAFQLDQVQESAKNSLDFLLVMFSALTVLH